MCGEASSVQERKLDRGTDRETTSFVPSHLVTVSDVTKDKTVYKIIYFLRCFAWLSVSLNNSKLGSDQTHSERRFEPFTRRLSMDSLMSEDEYNYHQRVERDPFRSVRRRRDIEDYHQSEYQEYHPSQTRHRALQCDGEFEPSFDNDRYLPPRPDWDQRHYRGHHDRDSVPGRRYQQSLEVTEDWRKYRGQWRSLYEGLDFPADFTSRGRRTEMDRNSRLSLGRRNYNYYTSAPTYQYRYPRRDLYEYYDRDEDFQ